MYRKKLMKVALSSIMAATVIVSGVPVYAADAPAVQQEEAKGEDVVVLYFADGVKIGQELLSGVKDHKFNITELKHIPEGYETVLTGDIAVQDGVAKVELKKEAEKPVVKNRNVYVKFETEDGKLLDAATVVTIGGKDTVFNTSKVKVPEGYELCEVGDVYVSLEDDAVTLKVREIAVPDRTVWVKFETEDGKLLDAATVVKLGGKDTVFNTSKVKVPEGYELCEVGDVYVSLEDDAVTLKVRKVDVPVEPEKPEKPEEPQKPQKPEEPQKPTKPNTTDKEDNKKDDKKKDDKKKEDKKKSPKTGDEVDPFAAALPAGVSLAAILAMLSKKYK